MFAIKVYKESQWPSFNSGSKKGLSFWTSNASDHLVLCELVRDCWSTFKKDTDCYDKL